MLNAHKIAGYVFEEIMSTEQFELSLIEILVQVVESGSVSNFPVSLVESLVARNFIKPIGNKYEVCGEGKRRLIRLHKRMSDAVCKLAMGEQNG